MGLKPMLALVDTSTRDRGRPRRGCAHTTVERRWSTCASRRLPTAPGVGAPPARHPSGWHPRTRMFGTDHVVRALGRRCNGGGDGTHVRKMSSRRLVSVAGLPLPSLSRRHRRLPPSAPRPRMTSGCPGHRPLEPSRLCGRTLEGNLYIYLEPASGLTSVTFYLDGGLLRIDPEEPGISRVDAQLGEATNVSALGAGRHVIVARGQGTTDHPVAIRATFSVPWDAEAGRPTRPGDAQPGGYGSREGDDVPPAARDLHDTSASEPRTATRSSRGAAGDSFLAGNGTVQNLFDGEAPPQPLRPVAEDPEGAHGVRACCPDHVTPARADPSQRSVPSQRQPVHRRGRRLPDDRSGDEETTTGWYGRSEASAAGIKQVSGTTTGWGAASTTTWNGPWCDKCDGGLMRWSKGT